MIIDRKIWLRGDPCSYLQRVSDGRMCCVGIHLHQLGVSADKLTGVVTAQGVRDAAVPEYLLIKGYTEGVYNINDSIDLGLTEDEREAQVAGWFAIFANTDVTFVN